MVGPSQFQTAGGRTPAAATTRTRVQGRTRAATNRSVWPAWTL